MMGSPSCVRSYPRRNGCIKQVHRQDVVDRQVGSLGEMSAATRFLDRKVDTPGIVRMMADMASYSTRSR